MIIDYSRRAHRDLEEIFDYIASDNPEAARRVRLAILATIELIAANPDIGIRNTRKSDMRSFLVARYPYRVHYLIELEKILVVHIRHTARRAWEGDR